MQSRSLRWLMGLTCWLAVCELSWAQAISPREQLFRLVPADSGFCLVINDLRGHWKATHQSQWLTALKGSPLGEMLTRTPEIERLLRLKEDLKKHLDIDLAQVREEIFGDAVVLAYRPASPDRSQEEEGLLLAWAKNPALLSQVIDRLNKAQKASGELLDLAAVDFQGKKYFRRAEQGKTNYYLAEGNLLAFSGKEGRIRGVIEDLGTPRRDGQAERHIQRAKADRAFATVWLNPRAFDADLQAKAQNLPGPPAQVLKAFLKYWHALDAIVLAGNLGAEPELRLTLQARTEKIPGPLRALFSKDFKRSELWDRFPEKAMLRVAGRIEFSSLLDIVKELTPPPARATLGPLKKTVAAALGMDPVKDFLPRLGPDWGFFIAAAEKSDSFPDALVAIAVQPGPKPVAAGTALFKAVQFFANLAVFEYNRTHADSIQTENMQQGNIQVFYLSNEKIFPTGFRPAAALKDGYFLLASSPEAIARFEKRTSVRDLGDDNPLLHLSLTELSAWLKTRKAKAAAFLQEKNNLSEDAAQRWLDGMLAGLNLFDHVTLTQRGEEGQVSWTLRLHGERRKR